MPLFQPVTNQSVIRRDGRRILVIVFDNAGDLVFTSAMLRQLGKAEGVDQLGVWTKDYTREIAELLPAAPLCFHADPFWDRSPLRGRGDWQRFWTVARQVQQADFQVALIPNHCWRSAFIAKLLGIRQRIGFARNWKNRILLTHTRGRMREERGIVPQLLDLLQPLGIQVTQGHYELKLDPAAALPVPIGESTGELIALHPFAGNPRRCAPLGMWLQFARALKDRGFRLIWLGAPSELARIRQESTDFAPYEFQDYFPDDLGFGGIARLVLGAKAYVGHDSGPLHIAHALGVPVLGLYLPSSYQRTYPQGPGVYVQCVRSSPAELTLEDWLAAWDEVLAKTD